MKSTWHLVIELGPQGPSPEEGPSEPELMLLCGVASVAGQGWRDVSDRMPSARLIHCIIGCDFSVSHGFRGLEVWPPG